MSDSSWTALQARILEWAAVPFFRGSSQPRDQTQVSHVAGRFFTSWATGKPENTGVGSLPLLQQIFPTQKSNQGLLHCRRILYQLSHKGSLRILEWVAYPFSRGSSQPRDQNGASCIAASQVSNHFLPAELPGKPINSLGMQNGDI